MDALHYRDFDLDIDPGAGRHYPVRVLTSPAGEARATMAFPFDAKELKQRLTTLEEAVTGYADSISEIQDFGTRLFDALFAGDIRLAYERSRQATLDRGQGLRVRLRINAPELATLPWEFLFDPIAGDFVVLSRATALVRYLETPISDSDKRIEPPIRILGMIASPSDAQSLDVAREQARLEQAIEPLRQAGQVDLVWLDGETASALKAALQRGPWHVFHFVGHAAFDQAAGEGTLLLADDQGRTSLLAATQLSRLLAYHPALQFVVLNACESAKGSEQSLFSSTAAALVRHGLPAVLAMQYPISDRAAIEFTAGFYGALSSGLPIEAAVAEARKALSLALPGSMEWGTPVLHMRMQSGQLFAERPAKRQDFYAHIPLPDNYIPRPDLLAGVRAALLDGAGGLALTSSIIMRTKTDALHGMGGIGKSVAARALCDDPDVQAAFPDGILWATLGQTPDLLARLREWIDVLGGIVSENAPTIERITAILAELLKDRACLLIVDDVWKKAHVEPFRAGGASCRLLLTTRDAALADEVGAVVHPVPVMAPDEAVALLEQWAGEGLRETAAEIVRRLGYLPLAIRLAGAQLRRRDPTAWLAGFDAAKLAARRVETVHDSLKATFDLSLDELSAEDRRLYIALAIFKEDEPASSVAIARLWSGLDGRDEEEATDLLDDLAARALVQYSQDDGDAVTIHDLLRDFMEAELGEEGRLAAHSALLLAYRRVQQGQGWATAPDDGYLYDHLAYHLDAVADHDPVTVEDLRSLFADQAWMNVRVPQCRYLYDGYLADLDVVWHRAHVEAHRQIDAGEEASAIGNCVRYALIRTSINALAANYVPELVARAVEVGLWPAERAFSVASKLLDPQAEADVWTAILKVKDLSTGEREHAIEQGMSAVLAIDYQNDRAHALAALASQLVGADQDRALEQALATALTIGEEWSRVSVLATLAPQLKGTSLEQDLVTAVAIDAKWLQVEAMVPELVSALLDQGLVITLIIRDDQYRAKTLAPLLLGRTQDQTLEQGLAAALAIGDERSRARTLTVLAPQLLGVAQDQALGQGLAAALAIGDEWSRARALTALVPLLSGASRDQALGQGLAAALAIGDEWSRARALTALVPLLSGASRDQALRQGLAAALAIGDEGSQARALAALAPQLSGAPRDEALEQGLAAALAIGDEGFRVKALTALAPQLTGALLEQGLAAALTIGDEWFRVQALAALAPQLMGALLQQGLAAALVIGDEWNQMQALAAVASQLSEAARDQALAHGLAAALAIGHEWSRAQALAAVAPLLSGAARDQAVEQGLAAALAIDIGDERDRARALAAIAPQLTGALLEQGLTAALAMSNEGYRAMALAAIAPQLTGALLGQGLTATLAMSNEGYRAMALAALAPQLTGALLKQGLAKALTIEDKWSQARALVALVPQLTGSARDRALKQGLAAALAISDKWLQVRVLEALAPHLTGAIRDRTLEQALAVAPTIDDEWNRAHALAVLVPQLTGASREKAFERWLAAAQSIANEGLRVHALAAEIPMALHQADLITRIRDTTVDHLYHNLSLEARPTLLRFCSDKNLFAFPYMAPSTVAAITSHIIEICQLWTWL